MLGSETLVYAGNARQKVGEVTSYFRTPGMSLLDWQNNSDCGRAGRAGGHNPPPFGLRAEPANTGTPPLPVGCSHIHPKTACRAGLGSRLGQCWALPIGERHPGQQA